MRWPTDASWIGDPDAIASLLSRITLIEVLHETQPPDEMGFVRLLRLFDRVVEFCFRQMLHQKTPWTALHRGLYASNGLNPFADHSCSSTSREILDMKHQLFASSTP